MSDLQEEEQTAEIEDVMDEASWLVNLESYDLEAELPKANKTNENLRLTSDGRPMYILNSEDELILTDVTEKFGNPDTLLESSLTPGREEAIRVLSDAMDRFQSRTEIQLFDMFSRIKNEIFPAFKSYKRALEDAYITNPKDPRCILLNAFRDVDKRYRKILALQIEHHSMFVRAGLLKDNRWSDLGLELHTNVDFGTTEEAQSVSILQNLKQKFNAWRYPERSSMKSLDAMHHDILQRTINNKLLEKKRQKAALRKKQLAHTSIYQRKMQKYYDHWVTNGKIYIFTISGMAALTFPLYLIFWSANSLLYDYGNLVSEEADEQDEYVSSYLYGTAFLHFGFGLAVCVFLLFGERLKRFRSFFWGDRIQRVRPIAVVGGSWGMVFESIKAIHLGAGPTGRSRFYTRASILAGATYFVLILTYIHAILIRPVVDKNKGYLNRVVMMSMSRLIKGLCCFKTSYRTDFKGKGLELLQRDTQHSKDILKALVTMPGWRLKKDSVLKVKKQRTKVNRYLRCIEDMQLDKAVHMMHRIYSGDMSQARVCEILIIVVHYSVYTNILKFADFNRRIQIEYDAIQDIYSHWRDLLDDLKRERNDDAKYQKWLRVNQFIKGSKSGRRHQHGKARISHHMNNIELLQKDKDLLKSRARYSSKGGFQKSSDWVLATRLLKRLAPIPRGWGRIDKGNGTVFYKSPGDKVFRSFRACQRHMDEIRYDLPWDKLWTCRNVSNAFSKIQRVNSMKHVRYEPHIIKYYKIENKEVRRTCKLELKIARQEARMVEKSIMYETEFKGRLRHEFKKYAERANDAILKQAAGKIG